MLIISYFLTFVLIISIIILLLPYFRFFIRQREQHKPIGLGREEFSEEFFPQSLSKEDALIDYNWKGNLNRKYTSGEIPSTYQDNKLVLLIRNPNCIYAYWETQIKWEMGTPVLRIYEIQAFGQEQDLSHFFDIEIFHDAKNWFFHVPKDNCSYFAELGQRMGDGTFLSILKSNLVKTPRSSLSPAIDENWIPCNLCGRLGNISYGLSSSDLQKEQERVDY